MYTLNGLGPNGSIPGGKPSTSARLLLRREALELALYSFRYLDDVDMVVVLLPPSSAAVAGKEGRRRTTQTRRRRVFFRPGDLRSRSSGSRSRDDPAPTPPQPKKLARPRRSGSTR